MKFNQQNEDRFGSFGICKYIAYIADLVTNYPEVIRALDGLPVIQNKKVQKPQPTTNSRYSDLLGNRKPDKPYGMFFGGCRIDVNCPSS